MRKRWDEFLCRLFKHRWKYIEIEDENYLGLVTWRFCRRCAVAEFLGPVPPQHPMCRCVINPQEE